jgi:hypothetical protein
MKINQSIQEQNLENETLPPILIELRPGADGIKTPDGYFDSLGSRIDDGIANRKGASFLSVAFPSVSKPLLWVPTLAAVVAVVLLVFVLPEKKAAEIPAVDEWTEIRMAIDASYAEEVLLSESHAVDRAIENIDLSYIQSATYTGKNEPTQDEISEYLKDQEIEPDILNEH